MTRFNTSLTALAVISSLAFAAPAVADEVNVRSMDQACRTDPALSGRCYTPSAESSYTLWEFSKELADMVGGNPDQVMESIIRYNQWQNMSPEEQLLPDVAFRIA